jgi:hypothetical protein
MWQKVLLLEMWQKLRIWFAPNFGWIYNIPTYTHHQDLMKSVGAVMAAHCCCCSWWRWWWSGNSLWANYPAPPYTSYDHKSVPSHLQGVVLEFFCPISWIWSLLVHFFWVSIFEHDTDWPGTVSNTLLLFPLKMVIWGTRNEIQQCQDLCHHVLE